MEEDFYSCDHCGDPSHKCLDELPAGAFYDAYGAETVDPNPIKDNYNFCGGQPLCLPEHKWPICPKHGPLLFLFQMTDQKPIEGEKSFDPCIIQVFICGTVYTPTYEDEKSVSVNLRCYTGGFLYDDDCRVQFDVGSYKNFAYFTRRFYPRKEMIFSTKPVEDILRILEGENIKLLSSKEATEKYGTDFVKNHSEQRRQNEVEFPRRDLVWKTFRMPYTLEALQKIYPEWEGDTNNYICFGKSEKDIPLVMHFDSIRQILSTKNLEFGAFTLIHHTLGWYEQHPSPSDYGYIFLTQECGYLKVCAHCNPAGGIGITSDLTMHFVL
jgi:hypothetical protein